MKAQYISASLFIKKKKKKETFLSLLLFTLYMIKFVKKY